jgi:hypothetical protein
MSTATPLLSTPTLSAAAKKMESYMTDLGLVNGKDFKVSNGPGDRVDVQMNHGHMIQSYRNGLEQVLRETGYTLQLTSALLYVRDKKEKRR